MYPLEAPKKQSQSNPISKRLRRFVRHTLFIDQPNRICRACGFIPPLVSAKMARLIDILKTKKQDNRPNIFRCKTLSETSSLKLITGTLFAHLYFQGIIVKNPVLRLVAKRELK